MSRGNGTCSVCGDPDWAKGLCSAHYQRQRRLGSPTSGGPRQGRLAATATDVERFFRFVSKADEDDGCWTWIGAVTPSTGYGAFSVDGEVVSAHRWSYEYHLGPVPAGLHVDHECHNRDPGCPAGVACLHRRCVNPAHFDAVTQAVNTRRGIVDRRARIGA